MASEPKSASELSELVQRMQHLKAEHTPLLTQIEGDRGMSSDVRQALQKLGKELKN